MTLRDELDKLSKAATQGEWEAEEDTINNIWDIDVAGADNTLKHIASCSHSLASDDLTPTEIAINAVFIPALVNAYRSGHIITREESEKMVEELREALEAEKTNNKSLWRVLFQFSEQKLTKEGADGDFKSAYDMFIKESRQALAHTKEE